MLRRLMLVPLAALGVATAFLVSGAGGAVLSVALASADSSGNEANAASTAPALSGDGRYVAFASDATNLAGVDPTPARTDIFVRDLQTGLTERISSGNGSSLTPSISDDGRWVAFESGATNLVPGDTNGCVDIFLFDRDTGSLVQVTEGNGNSGSAAVSGDGGFVAFGSFASDLVPSDTSTGDVFRWDRIGGTTTKASVSTAGIGGDDLSSIPSISDDGATIAFNSRATNLIAGDTNGTWDVIVRDFAAGTTEAASVSTAGVLAGPNFFGSGEATVSGNGRYVAFNGNASNLVTGVSGGQVYLRDRVGGTTTLVSAGNGTTGGSVVGSVNDGGRVVFASFAALVPDDTNFRTDVYLSDPVERVSLTDALGQGTSPTSSGGASSPSMSADGSRVVVQNTLTNIVAGTTTLPNLVAYTVGTGSGGGTTSTAATTATIPTTTTTTTTTTIDVTPPDVQLPGRADLVVTKTASEPASGESFAPGESVTYTVEVVNAGTATAVNVSVHDDVTALQLGSGAPNVSLTVTAPDCSVSPGPGGGPVVASASLDCPLGDIPPRGGRRTVTYSVIVTGDEIPINLTNRVSTAFATNDADESDNSDETTVRIDTGERECDESPCESGPGTTTTTCVDDAVCKYGGEGVMNTICRDEATCGGGPLRELHVVTGGATQKDKVGEPNVFRCSGEGTYCAGIGTFTCTDGAFCRIWGKGSQVRCEDGRVDLRGDGNAANVNGCDVSVADDKGVIRGGAKQDTIVMGGGGFVTTGGEGNYVDTRNGERNTVVCTGKEEDRAIVDTGLDRVSGCVLPIDLAVESVEMTASPWSYSLTGADEIERKFGAYLAFATPEARIVVVNNGPAGSPAFVTWEAVALTLATGAFTRATDFGLGPDARVVDMNAERGTCDDRSRGEALRVRCSLGFMRAGERRTVLIRIGGVASRTGSHGAMVGDAPEHCSESTDRDCKNNRRSADRLFNFFAIGAENPSSSEPDPDFRFGRSASFLDIAVTGTGPVSADGRSAARYEIVTRNLGEVTATNVDLTISVGSNLGDRRARVVRPHVEWETPPGGSCSDDRNRFGKVVQLTCFFAAIPPGAERRVVVVAGRHWFGGGERSRTFELKAVSRFQDDDHTNNDTVVSTHVPRSQTR